MPKKRSLDEKSISSSSKKQCTSQEALFPQSCSQIVSQNCNEIKRCGKILRMKLINFMCHDNLVINFGNRINLLVGNNGSGKSAVLTALIVGLGSTARTTNRSTNIKQLIKNGENSATIEIDITNDNWDAYDQEIFGNKITIIRNININGSSTYKIKSSDGRIIFKSNENLQRILLYHNIQVDNPVVVLNQDNARSYLKDLDPTKNYQLFLRATQLETIREKLEQCTTISKNYVFRLNCFRERIDIMKEEVLKLQKKYDCLRSADNLKANLKRYKLEKIWIKVAEQQNIVDNLKKEIDHISDEQKKYETIIKNKNAIENEFNTKTRHLEEQLNKLNDSFQREDQKLKILESDYDKEIEKSETEERNCQKIQNKINNLKQQITTLKQSISDRSNSSQVNELLEENERKISEYQAQLKELEAMIISTRRDIDLISDTKDEYEREFEELKSRRQRIINDIENVERHLKAINTSRKNVLSVYGEDTDKLLLSIEKAYKSGKFSEMPKGPVGRYIEVINKKWINAIEYLLSNCINLFLVSSQNDRKVLDQILKDEFPGVKKRIVTNRFCHEVYNVQRGMVHPPKGSRLLMDEIRCNDPVIMNCLIDRAHIETILLVENQDLAIQLTSASENIPQNLQKIILLDPAMEYYPLPLFRAYSIEFRQSRYLQVNIEQRIKQMENELKTNQNQKKSIENELQRLTQILKDIYIREKQTHIKLQQHEKSKHNVNSNLEELQSIEFIINEDEIRILKTELNEFQTKLESLESNLKEKLDLCKKYLMSKESKEKLYNEKKQYLNSMNQEIMNLKTKIVEIERERDLKLIDVQAGKQKSASLLAELKEKKKIYEDELNKLHSLRENAQEEGEYVETKKSEKELTELIRNIEIKIEQITSNEDNIDDVKALLDDKSTKLERTIIILNELTKTIGVLKDSRNQRFKVMRALKEQVTYRIKYAFDNVLSIRGYIGEIRIDHNNQQLNVTVIPRDNHIENAVSNTKSLSGGERSFSTIAFLLSLWSCIDHPFYFLDEYDVFTDQINRQIINKLLFNEARKKPKCQFVFLTPQDMSFVEASDLVKIHRMLDPRKE